MTLSYFFMCVPKANLRCSSRDSDFFFFFETLSHWDLALLSSFLLLLVLGLQTHACHHAQLFKWVLGTQCRSLCLHKKVPYRLSYFSSTCLFLKIKGVSLFLGRVSCMSVHLIHSTTGKGIFGWFLLQISAIAL